MYITKEELDQLGITYDTAIPQSVFNEILEVTHSNPSCHIVWVYRDCNAGRPVAVSNYGRALLEAWQSERHKLNTAAA